MQNIGQIYEEYFETVNKYLFCLTNNNDVSEELTQETFCKAIEKIDTYKGTCKLSVWLCQIAKNLWYDQCRKNKKFENNMHIDKNTGLVINAGACEVLYVDSHLDRVSASDYIYEFNVVTEDDFMEPDISEYELRQ